jgi:hypothetical protein
MPLSSPSSLTFLSKFAAVSLVRTGNVRPFNNVVFRHGAVPAEPIHFLFMITDLFTLFPEPIIKLEGRGCCPYSIVFTNGVVTIILVGFIIRITTVFMAAAKINSITSSALIFMILALSIIAIIFKLISLSKHIKISKYGAFGIKPRVFNSRSSTSTKDKRNLLSQRNLGGGIVILIYRDKEIRTSFLTHQQTYTPLIIPVGFSAAFPTIYDLLKDAWYELAIILAKQQHRPRQGRIWLHLFEATLTEMHHSPLYPKAVLILNRIGWNTFPKNKSPRERERGRGKEGKLMPSFIPIPTFPTALICLSWLAHHEDSKNINLSAPTSEVQKSAEQVGKKVPLGPFFLPYKPPSRKHASCSLARSLGNHVVDQTRASSH